MSFPGASKITIDTGPTVKVTVNRPRAPYARGGAVSLNYGADQVVVTFGTPLPDANYVVAGLSVQNWTDNPNLTPFITARLISAPSQSGFTVQLSSGPPAGTSYKLHWAIAEVFNP